MKKRFLWICVFFLSGFCLFAAEFINGQMRLVLREDMGRFSLYGMNENSQFEPLFSDQDPRTSFISLLINDRAYKLGDTSSFRTRTDTIYPSFIFESPSLLVTEEFNFIKTPGSGQTNGVEIKITVENRGTADTLAGLRFLLDTHLGERGSYPPFSTDTRSIMSETLIERGDEKFWISQNNRLSLMGSIVTPNGEAPDSLYFANWKRLNDVSWKIAYEPGRNFNAPPYSIGDSAVCYYYGPRTLAKGESFTALIMLASGVTGGFTPSAPAIPVLPGSSSAAPAGSSAAVIPVIPNPAVEINPADQRERDMIIMQDLIARIDEYISAGSITEEELNAMEQTLDRMIIKYGIDTEALQ